MAACGGLHAFAAEPATGKFPAPFRVIPQPRKVTLLDGAGLGHGAIRGLYLGKGAARPAVGGRVSALPLVGAAGAGALSLTIDPALACSPSAEAYRLEVRADRASITARAQPGLFYGCQTLRQLLIDSRESGAAVPACRIDDYPALAYRAVHIDVKHHLDHLKYYYECIDRLASYKINAVIFELEDKLRYVRQPLVGAPHAISISEMAALARYARRRQIEISPLVQGLGHASFILKHPHYAKLREVADSPWVFCPLDEGTYNVLFDLYRDAMDATPGSRYLHVGGDEIRTIGVCSRCKPTAAKDGVLGLNLYWLNRVCAFAVKHGRTPIFWDDMPLNHAGLWQNVREYTPQTKAMTETAWTKGQPILDKMIERFPKTCVYMRWTYNLGRGPGNIRALDWYRQRGLRVFVATAAQNVSPLMPRDDRVNIIQSFVSLAAERGMEGMLCTAWDDSSPHMETYWRGLAASGEYSWSPHGRTLAQYEVAWLQRAFGPACTGATTLYADLHKGIDLWSKGLLAKGTRRRNPGKYLPLPDPKAPGAWSKTHKRLLAEAGREWTRYQKTSKQLARMLKDARRNRYHLELLTAINDFQITTARLLLALASADVADPEQRAYGQANVQAALNAFGRAWPALKAAYARTRFGACPPGTVPDRYFHLASQREDESWLIQVEQAFHPAVRKWIQADRK